MTTPQIHPANACAPAIRLRAARMISGALYDKGMRKEADYLAYLAAALPLLGKKSAQDLAKAFSQLAD